MMLARCLSDSRRSPLSSPSSPFSIVRAGGIALATTLAVSASANAQSDLPDAPAASPIEITLPAHAPEFVPSLFPQNPFLPRAGLVLYGRQTVSANGGGLWGLGGAPAGSGTQPDIIFDDVNIPVARLVEMVSGTQCSVVEINRITFTLRQLAGAPAGTMNLYWTTFDSRLNPTISNSTLRTPYDIPPEPLHLIGSVTFPAAAAITTRTFTIGSDTSPALFTVPLHLNTATTTAGVAATLGTFAIGQQVVAPSYTTFQAQLTSGADPNLNILWYYDSDQATPERTVAFASNSAYNLQLFGSPVLSMTPTACCLAATSGPACFLADGADNCLQSGGTVVTPSQATCTPLPCVQLACCNPVTGACGFFAVAACADGRIPAASGTCTPNTCAAPPIPVNNECTGALPLTLAMPLTNQVSAGCTNSFAAGTAACTFFTQVDVWYSFTTASDAPADGIYLVRAISNPTSGLNLQQQLVIKAYNACPVPDVTMPFDCFDSTSATGDLTFTAGPDTTIFFSVQVQSAAPSALFSISIDPVNTRACCSPVTGLCILSTITGACTNPDYPNQGAANSTCTPNTCPPPPTGACCAASGDCQVVTTGACTLSGGIYQGDNASCTVPTNPCPQPIVCCTGAACTVVLLTTCTTGGGAPNAAPSCAPNPCGGACCANDGSCSLTTQAACATNFLGLGTVCTGPTNPCPQPQTGVCCQSDGSCTPATPGIPDATCATGTLAVGGTCSPNTCPPPIGICCTANACSHVADVPGAFACTSGGGTFNSAVTTCTPDPCAPPQGVCCRGSSCIVDAALQSQAACAAAVTGTAGAKFVAAGPCGGANHLVPCCHADYDKINGRSVTDIFAFLSDWFASRPWAVVGGAGTGAPAVGHIFNFLTDWFAGGCP